MKNFVTSIVILYFCIATALSIDPCSINDNDCAACQAQSGCGFCGVYGQGYCMSGNEQGSTLGNNDIAECPTDFWKFTGTNCKDPVRVVKTSSVQNANGETIKYQWESASFDSPGGNKRVTFDYLVFAVAIQDENNQNDSGRAFSVATGYTSGHIGDKNTNVKLFGAWFGNVFEYVDFNNDGFDLADLYADPDWLPLYNVSYFKSFGYTVDTSSNPGSKLYTANAITIDDKVSFTCRIGDSDWDYYVPYSNDTRVLHINPYEMKCDITASGWQYRAHPNKPAGKEPTLGVQGFVLSANFEISLDPQAQNDDAIKNGEVTFGNGVGFFKWTKTVNGTNDQSGISKEYKIIVTDLDLPNATSPDLPPGTAIKTTIYTIENRGDVINSFVWDPVTGIDPVKGAPLNPASNLQPVFSLFILAIAFIAIWQ